MSEHIRWNFESKAMKKRKPLKNGWKYFADEPPPDRRVVIVTNNPEARNNFGHMSHIWMLQPIKSSPSKWVGFLDDGQKVHDLVAWHAAPRNA